MEGTLVERHLGKIMIGLGTLGFVVGGIVLFHYWRMFGDSLSKDQAIWGQFGDYVGGILGSVFALLALVALLLTLRLQSRELRLSSEELKNSARALAEQSQSLSLQNFENRFFNMLSLHHQIVNGMDLRKGGVVTASGRDCLKIFYDRLKTAFESALRGDSIDYRKGLEDGYENFYQKHSHELGHYFRYIYRILKFIDESQVSNKREYSGILRAQLSNPELALLFYNGITWRGSKLKPLAEKYALFENLELKLLVRLSEDSKFYDMAAFGDQAGALSEQD